MRYTYVRERMTGMALVATNQREEIAMDAVQYFSELDPAPSSEKDLAHQIEQDNRQLSRSVDVRVRLEWYGRKSDGLKAYRYLERGLELRAHQAVATDVDPLSERTYDHATQTGTGFVKIDEDKLKQRQQQAALEDQLQHEAERRGVERHAVPNRRDLVNMDQEEFREWHRANGSAVVPLVNAEPGRIIVIPEKRYDFSGHLLRGSAEPGQVVEVPIGLWQGSSSVSGGSDGVTTISIFNATVEDWTEHVHFLMEQGFIVVNVQRSEA